MAKKPNWTAPLVLAATLLAAGSLSYWSEYSRRPKKEAEAEANKKLFNIGERPVLSIKLAEGSRAFTLTCGEQDHSLCKQGASTHWEISAPVKMRADETSINYLLTNLNNSKVEETIDLSQDSADKRVALMREYGLSDEARKSGAVKHIEIQFADGTALSAYFGRPHPVTNGLFAITSRSETQVSLTGSFIQQLFEKDLFYWRNKAIFSFKDADIGGFDIKSPRVQAHVRRSSGGWILSEGKTERDADSESVGNFLSTLTHLPALQFTAEAKSEPIAKKILGSAKKILSIHLSGAPEAKDFKPLDLEFWSKKTPDAQGKGKVTDYKATDHLYMTASTLDPLFALETSNLAKLEKSTFDFRVKRLITSSDKFNLKRITFEGPKIGATPLALIKSDASWSIENPKGPADSQRVQALLDDFSGDKIKSIRPTLQAPAKRDEITVSFGDETNPTKRKLVIWKSGSEVFAQDLLSKSNETWVIDPGVWVSLPNSSGFFTSHATPPPLPTALPSGPKQLHAPQQPSGPKH